jgi:2,4-dienoyl-CoA reductase (NADPH2)
MILLCGQLKNSWQKQLLYRERRKIVGLLSPNQRSSNILVPVDLSDTTLLLLKFLNRTYLQITNVNMLFIHVLTDSERTVRKRWRVLKQICDLNSNSPSLTLIPPRGDIASSIMDTVIRNEVGTIVMGKRGLSGIKRWLLGSVSVGVLRQLTDQSLILID